MLRQVECSLPPHVDERASKKCVGGQFADTAFAAGRHSDHHGHRTVSLAPLELASVSLLQSCQGFPIENGHDTWIQRTVVPDEKMRANQSKSLALIFEIDSSDSNQLILCPQGLEKSL